MPDSWSVPIAPGVIPSSINDRIAQGPDLSWINNLANSYFQGKDQQYTQAQRDVFKGLTPQDLAGGNLGNLLTKVASIQGAPALPGLMQLAKMQYGQQTDQQISGQNGSPVGGQTSAQPLVSPSSAPA